MNVNENMPPLMTVRAAIVASGMSQTRMYALIGAGAIKSVKFRARILVKTETLKPYIDEARVLKKAAKPNADSLAYSVEDACRISSLGRTTIYKLIEDGHLESVKVRNKRLVKGESLRRLLETGCG